MSEVLDMNVDTVFGATNYEILYVAPIYDDGLEYRDSRSIPICEFTQCMIDYLTKRNPSVTITHHKGGYKELSIPGWVGLASRKTEYETLLTHIENIVPKD